MIDGQLGTDGTLFNETQTGALAPILGTKLSITKSDITNGIKVSYELPEGTGNGYSYQEFEIISADTTSRYTRVVFPQLDKVNTVKFMIDSDWEFDKNNE